MKLFEKKTNAETGRVPYVSAVIAAAGNSTRMGGVSKQFLLLSGVPALIRTLRAFEDCPLIREINLAVREEDIPETLAMLKDFNIARVRELVKGGFTRQESVFRAVRRCSEQTEFFAIHDGARPLVTPRLIEDTVLAAFQTGAAAAAVRLNDTIKVVGADNIVRATPDRAFLRAVQTPQVFEKELYFSAMRALPEGAEFTDDCALIEAYGGRVVLIEGSSENFKLTAPEDVRLAEAVLRGREKKNDQNRPWL